MPTCSSRRGNRRRLMMGTQRCSSVQTCLTEVEHLPLSWQQFNHNPSTEYYGIDTMAHSTNEAGTRYVNNRIKGSVNQFLQGCGTHCTSTGCREGDLNVYFAHTMTCRGQSRASQCSVVPRQVYHQFTHRPRRNEMLVGLSGKPEAGNWNRIRLTAGASSYVQRYKAPLTWTSRNIR